MTFSTNPPYGSTEHGRLTNAHRLAELGEGSVDELLFMLTDPSWVVRRAVIEALAEVGQPAVKPLCELLRTKRDNEARLAAAVDSLVASRAAVEPEVTKLAADEDPAVVADAAQILGRRRSQPAIPLLSGLIGHADDNVAVAAIEALGKIGGRVAVQALIETVESGNFFRTFPAIGVLGRSGDPRVVKPLAQLLHNPSYLPEAARALGRTGERSAVKPLLELMASPSDAIVRVAAVAVCELRERFAGQSGGSELIIDELVRNQVDPSRLRRIIRALTGADPTEAVALCELLGRVGNAEAAPALSAVLDSPAPIASTAAEALKRLGRDADEPVLQVLRGGSSGRRKVLLPIVSRSSAAPDVTRCLQDPDPEVRAIACDTLARLGNPQFVASLFPLLEDPNLRVVHSATSAIQTLGNKEGRTLAIKAAKSPNPVVRRSAIRILAYFGHDDSVQPLLDALDDPDPRVREAAMQGLPYLEDPRAVAALLQAARSSLARMRALAMRSLGHLSQIDDKISSALLTGLADEDPWVRYYACQSLGRCSYVPAAARIAAMLQDDAGQVRVSAVEALSHLDAPEAHQALQEAVASPDVEVKRAALVGLGITHRAEDLPMILSATGLPDPSTRLVALSALANFPSPIVLGTLGSSASDADEQISSAAISILSTRPEQEATEVLIELLASEATREKARLALLAPSEGRLSGLLVALESANDVLAPLLISILSKMERPQSKTGLLAAMKLNNVAARKAAAKAVAARKDSEMAAALQDAAENDPDADVRQICTLLLRG